MRMPELETLNCRSCPQKEQRPVVIAFVKRLALPFTKPFRPDLDDFCGTFVALIRIRPLGRRHYVALHGQCHGHVNGFSWRFV